MFSLSTVENMVLPFKHVSISPQPTDSTDAFYDAKIKLSRQSMTEIEMILEGEESCRTGAVDNAISHILVDLRPHDYEAWKWRFEDTFGVELDIVLKVSCNCITLRYFSPVPDIVYKIPLYFTVILQSDYPLLSRFFFFLIWCKCCVTICFPSQETSQVALCFLCLCSRSGCLFWS